MIISILYNPAWMKDDFVRKLRTNFPQFNHVIKNTNRYLSPDKLDYNLFPIWPYYIIRIKDKPEDIEYDEKTNILYCNEWEILNILENVNDRHNVILDVSSAKRYIEVLAKLEYRYKTIFHKVWEKKGKKYVYNRGVSAEFWGVINNIKWQFPELCNTGWHWCKDLYDALSYKKYDWDEKHLYYWEMECHSVIDYWEDKVSCLSCSFTEPKQIDTDMAKEICNKWVNGWQDINRTAQDSAPYLDIKLWAKYPGSLTAMQIANIIDAIKRTQYSNNRFSLYLYKSKSWLYTNSPQYVHPYGKERLEISLLKRFDKEMTKKIIKYLEDNCDILFINPFR